MKLYNRERKSEEIAETPDRVGNSNRAQGKDKRGKSADTNSFEALSEEDDKDEEEHELNKGTSCESATLTNEANVLDNKEESRKLTNNKTDISNFFTPNNQQKKKATLDGNKDISTTKQRLAKLEGGDGKQGSGSKVKELVEKTVVTPLVSVLRATSTSKESASHRVGKESTQEMDEDGEEGRERVVAYDMLPTVQIREKSSNNSGSKAIKGKGGTPRSKPSDTTSSTKKTSFAQMATKQPTKIVDKPLQVNTAVVSLSFKVLKGEDPRTTFGKKMAQALKFLHEECDEPEAAVLPVDHVGEVFVSTKTIKKLSDMPKYAIKMKHYFCIPNQRSFNPVQNNSRIIKASAKMLFKSDPKTLLEEAGPDLRNLGCGVYYKQLQEVNSESDHILLGAPMVMTVERVEKEFQRLLKITEKGIDYSGKWELPIKVTKEHAPGMPWETEEEKKTSKITTASKQVFIIHVSKKNHGRLTELLKEIKHRKELHKEWGPTAFTVQLPDFEDGDELKRKYQQMIGVHISIQMSLGQVLIPGIVDLNKKFSLTRLPDAEGPRSPTLQSVKDLLLLMTVGEGRSKKKLFSCVAEAGNGVVCGYFSSADQSIKDRVPKIRTIIAAQLYYFLMKRGVTTESIKKMFKKAFTIEQNKSVTSSKYSKTEGYAKVKEEMGDDIIRAAEAAGIDTSLGLTASQLRERRDNKDFDATQIAFGKSLTEDEIFLTYGASEVGAFEAYEDLGEEQSQTTLHTKKSNNSRSVAVNTLAQSKYSIDASSSTGDNSADDEGIDGEESEPETGKRMLFEGLELLKSPEEDGASLNGNDDKDKEEEETLDENQAIATKNIEVANSDEEEFQDPLNEEEEGAIDDNSQSDHGTEDSEEDEEDEEVDSEEMEDDESESSMDTELGVKSPYSLAEELEILQWDTHENEERRRLQQEMFRMIEPKNFQDQLSNEAGPTLKGMIEKCVQVEHEMMNMSSGQVRDASRYSDTLLQELQKEAASSDIDKMMKQAEKVRGDLEASYLAEVMQTESSRNAAIDETFKFAEWEADAINVGDIETNTQARKTRSGERLTESRAKND